MKPCYHCALEAYEEQYEEWLKDVENVVEEVRNVTFMLLVRARERRPGETKQMGKVLQRICQDLGMLVDEMPREE